MYSTNQHDNEKFSSSPAPSAPPPYTQSMPANGIPVNSTGQYNQYVNFQPPQQHVVQPGGEGPWSTGLCDCFSDFSSCCITCWCPCITCGHISEIVDKEGYVLDCLPRIPCLWTCRYRSKMRKQLMLSGSCCGDCFVHFCCQPCALCQEYRELKIRGLLGGQGNAERQNGGVLMAPVVQGGMSR